MFVLGAPSFRFLDRQIKLLRKEKVKLKNKKYCPGSDFASLILSLHSHSLYARSSILFAYELSSFCTYLGPLEN